MKVVYQQLLRESLISSSLSSSQPCRWTVHERQIHKPNGRNKYHFPQQWFQSFGLSHILLIVAFVSNLGWFNGCLFLEKESTSCPMHCIAMKGIRNVKRCSNLRSDHIRFSIMARASAAPLLKGKVKKNEKHSRTRERERETMWKTRNSSVYSLFQAVCLLVFSTIG